MTTPSDIAGLSERLRFDAARCELHYSKGIASNIDEAATALDSLSARVKEADEACQRLCRDHGFATGHGDSVADMIDEISAQVSARLRGLETNPPLLDARSISGVDELVRSLEARATRLQQQRDEAYERLKALVDADALAGVRKLVAGWNGEDRPEGPFNERHPDRLGATLPKTNCGAIYQLDDAMVAARAAIRRLASGTESGALTAASDGEVG